MNRRTFAGLTLAAIGGVFAPRFGRWYRQGSGLLVPEPWVTVRGGAWDDPATWGRLTAPPAQHARVTVAHRVALGDGSHLDRIHATLSGDGHILLGDNSLVTDCVFLGIERSEIRGEPPISGAALRSVAALYTHPWRFNP